MYMQDFSAPFESEAYFLLSHISRFEEIFRLHYCSVSKGSTDEFFNIKNISMSLLHSTVLLLSLHDFSHLFFLGSACFCFQVN